MNAAAAWSANNNRHAGAPAISAFGGEVCDLIERAGNEVGELHFRNRPHSHEGGADCGTDDSGFGNRRIDDPPFPELFKHAGGDFESAAVDAYIFSEDEHTLVLLHLFPDSLTDRFYISG